MIDEKTLQFVKKFEGFKDEAYLDGGGVPTIGWGTTYYKDGTKVKLGDKITVDQANTELAAHCNKIKESILNLILDEERLHPTQLRALISFVYNIGVTAFEESTMLKLINQGLYRGAGNQFDRWVYDNKVKINGLVKRRLLEKQLFLLYVP